MLIEVGAAAAEPRESTPPERPTIYISSGRVDLLWETAESPIDGEPFNDI